MIFYSTRKNCLRHRRGNGRAPADPFGLLFLQRISASRVSGPAQQFQLALAQFRLKKASSVGVVCGNDSSVTNKADLSATDGINSEHKQKQRKSSKDARPARWGGQPTSRRRVRDSTCQHGRGGGTPSHQPALDKGIRATHLADATPTRSTTGQRRP